MTKLSSKNWQTITATKGSKRGMTKITCEGDGVSTEREISNAECRALLARLYDVEGWR